MTAELRNSINHLYEVFKGYKIDNFKTLTLFDYGPSEGELADLESSSLRNLSERTISSMEFFGEGWDSWGTEIEVKHFIPRILEIIATQIMFNTEEIANSDQFIWLCKYKLRNCFSNFNNHWSKDEKKALLTFFESLAKFIFKKGQKLGYRFEALILAGVTSDTLKKWWSIEDEALFEKQVKGLLSYFEVFSLYPIARVKPAYADPKELSAELISIIEWSFEQLPEKIQQDILTDILS